ncbi:MAG: PadR family transcriptional regulator [Anaerolineales bacterium]|jgi:DNA-binding PadR family transcriptional regulator
MTLQHVILGMLRRGPKSGYDLNKQLETTIRFFWEADISRIYRSLRSMQEQGWVEFETVVQDDSPNKKVYSLTEQGRSELKRWLAEPGKPSGSNNPFLAQLHFSDAISIQEQLHVLTVRREEVLESLAELERRARLQDLPVPLPHDALEQGVTRDKFSLEYGVRRMRLELDWVENTIAVLRADIDVD